MRKPYGYGPTRVCKVEKQTRCGVVGDVTALGGDSALEEVWIRTFKEHLFVVVGF
jgi:hypothetical protein